MTADTRTDPAARAVALADRLRSPIPLLVATGSLLAFTIILSRLASDRATPMLWYLGAVMGLAGMTLLLAASLRAAPGGERRRVLRYSLGSGCFQALPTTLAFLAVAHVGAGFLTLVYVFPLLLTYVLAVLLGMDRLSPLKILAVTLALAGGLILASARFSDLALAGGDTIWIFAAISIPFVLAAGNLYRTRYWPAGAPPLQLAAWMLLVAASLVLLLAVPVHGIFALPILWQDAQTVLLTLANASIFALQFVCYFRLQQVAGPVYLSQIGSVSAAVGVPVSVLFLGEHLPAGFALAAISMIAGVVLFQYARTRELTPHAAR